MSLNYCLSQSILHKRSFIFGWLAWNGQLFAVEQSSTEVKAALERIEWEWLTCCRMKILNEIEIFKLATGGHEIWAAVLLQLFVNGCSQWTRIYEQIFTSGSWKRKSLVTAGKICSEILVHWRSHVCERWANSLFGFFQAGSRQNKNNGTRQWKAE